jgi:hypothetical protein
MELLVMRNTGFTLAYGAMLLFGMAGPDVAQDDGGKSLTLATRDLRRL